MREEIVEWLANNLTMKQLNDLDNLEFELQGDGRFTIDELDNFINTLNFDIQYLGLTKLEFIDIIEYLYN